MNVCILSVALLAFIIYKTGYVYWYNGISYEDAVKAGQERRKVYAWKHVRSFGGFALVFVVFSIIAQVCHISYWWDIVLGTVGIVVITIIITIVIIIIIIVIVIISSNSITCIVHCVPAHRGEGHAE